MAAIERLVATRRIASSAASTCSISPRATASTRSAIAAFLHAARLGLFELSWNVLCPGCGGVLDANATLKTVRAEDYNCALCAAGYEPTLDEMVEVTFTVSPRVRRIAAHDPHDAADLGILPPDLLGLGRRSARGDLAKAIEEITLDSIELPPGEKAILSLQLPAEFVIVFEPVTHAAQFIDVKGEPTRERQTLTLVYNMAGADRHRGDAARAAAAVAGEPHRPPRAARRVDRRRRVARSARQAQAVPDRQAPAHQPDLPRHLSHRHARRRPAPQDHQPHLPVHRPQGLDRALRARRRPRRLRPGARAFPRAATRSSPPRPAPWSRPSATR